MKANNHLTMARLWPKLLKSKQIIQSKCGRFFRKGRLIYIYVFIPLPLAVAIGPDVGVEAQWSLTDKNTLQVKHLVGRCTKLHNRRRGGWKRNCLPLSTPVFYAGVFQRNQKINIDNFFCIIIMFSNSSFTLNH